MSFFKKGFLIYGNLTVYFFCIGFFSLVQFRDLNDEVNLFQRNFVNEVKRADDMLRKIRYFSDQIKNTFRVPDGETASIATIADLQNIEVQQDEGSQSLNMDDLEAQFDDLEKELTTMGANQVSFIVLHFRKHKILFIYHQ